MAAKFRLPAIKPAVLVRQRLLDRLTEGVRGPLTLITAPAGSGKTVLASSWVAAGSAPGPVTWVTLDEEDGRSEAFWSYVLAGLARIGLRPADQVDRSLLVRLAARLSEAAEPVVLVLDNAERLAGGRLATEIDFVLRHAGGQLRLVLATRTEPDLPLHHYRLDGSLTEIRYEDLAFTAAEVTALHGGSGPADPAVLARLARAGGWAAGLRLAGADLAAYFRAEVLTALPAEVRHLLLSTCVVDRLPAGLARHLSELRDADTLAGLAAAGGFVAAVPAEGGGFRYHPLIRDLLRDELEVESPARRRALHRKAARWLSDAGHTDEAVRQYAAARDWPDAAALVVAELAVGRLLTAPPGSGLAGALGGLPAGVPLPETAVVAAALAFGRQDHQECGKHLARATELTQGEIDQPELRLAVATVGTAFAAATGAADGAFAAASAAGAALAELLASGRTAPPELPALLLASVGRAHLSAGNLDAARASLAAAGRSAHPPGCERLRARCLADLACTEAVSGRLRRARGFAARAAALAAGSTATEPAGTDPAGTDPAGTGPAGTDPAAAGPAGTDPAGSAGDCPITAELALAWVSTERAETHQGRRHADAAAAAPELDQDPLAAALLALVSSRLLRARGDFGGAVAALAAARAAPVRPPRWLASRLDAAEAVLLVAQGRSEAALDVLDRTVLPDAPESQLARGWVLLSTGAAAAAGRAAHEVLRQGRLPLDVRVDALLLAAAGELDLSRPEAARVALGRAIRLAEPEQLRRPFQQARPRLRRALREQEQRGAAGILHTAADPVAPADAIVQPLTEREQEVLAHLAALLPTEQIAAAMFVSVNTVKTHIRAILRKLSVQRRNDAVRRARELGLV
jgi:LuxR family transcriptional regulator, maltose regulon positive regulatory protein